MLLRLFWNPRERRVRLLVRLVGQLVIFGLVLVGLIIPAGLAMGLRTGEAADSLGGLAAETPELLVLGGLATLVATLASLWAAGRLLDRRPMAGFGFNLSRGWWRDLAFGLALGAALMTGIFLVELAAGWVTVRGVLQTAQPGRSFLGAIAMPVVLFLCVGIYEEALARGYLLRNLSEGLNFRFVGRRGAILLAWVISSIVFGALHAGNPNAGLVSTANLVVAGLLLGLGTVLTGELALPIGLHITWNLFQGNVYGFPVSGGDFTQATVIAIAQGGPDWLTGGAFGPEAGVLGLAATLVGMVLIVAWVRRRGPLALDARLGQPPAASEG
jgi:membrane protease YdiL (CAAX protease family)